MFSVNICRFLSSLIYPQVNICEVPRSPQWLEVRAKFLLTHPRCEACGGNTNLEVHHKIPFHIDKSLELVEDNLITLCEKPGHNCHFIWGHQFNWKNYRLNVVEAVAWFVDQRKNVKISGGE